MSRFRSLMSEPRVYTRVRETVEFDNTHRETFEVAQNDTGQNPIVDRGYDSGNQTSTTTEDHRQETETRSRRARRAQAKDFTIESPLRT